METRKHEDYSWSDVDKLQFDSDINDVTQRNFDVEK